RVARPALRNRLTRRSASFCESSSSSRRTVFLSMVMAGTQPGRANNAGGVCPESCGAARGASKRPAEAVTWVAWGEAGGAEGFFVGPALRRPDGAAVPGLGNVGRDK